MKMEIKNSIKINKMNEHSNNSPDYWMDYQTALQSTGDIYLAQDLTSKGQKHYNCLKVDDVITLSKEDLNLYEIIKEDRPHKMYIDLDCKYNSVRKFFDSKPEDVVKKTIVDVIEGFVEEFQETYFPESPAWKSNVLDASNKIKYSFHFAVDIKLKNFDESEAFHKKFLQFIHDSYDGDDDYYNLQCYIDKCVYTKNRLLRSIGQSKFGQDRPLKIFSGSEDPKDHFVTYFPNDKGKEHIPHITLPAGWAKSNNNKRTKLLRLKKQLPREKNYGEDEELQYLVENTQHKTEKYDDWIKWVFACLGAGISPELIHEFSFNGCPEKYSESGTNQVINQYIREKSTMGIHTLKAWATEAGHEIQRDVEVKAKPLSHTREGHLTWIDLVKKYHGKVFPSKSEMIYTIRDDVSQVIAMIQGKETLFTIYSNDENPYDIGKNLCHLELIFEQINNKGKECLVDINLQKLMVFNPLDFPLYNKIVFKPRDYGLRKNERNTFSGFQAQEFKDECIYDDDEDKLPEEIQLLLHHIKIVLASGNPKHYLYIMSWLTQIIKTPWKPTDIFLLFQGNQGSGKTIVSDFLVKHVFGKHLSLSTSGIDSLTSRFNGAVKSKLFVCCNELTTVEGGKGSFNSAFDRMKNLITDRLVQIEHKGLEHVQIDNFCNFIGNTNHSFTAKLEKGDRRYACFEVNNEYIKNYDYFDKLGDALNQNTGDMFYTYLLNYPEEKMVDLRRIPETNIRKQLINNSRNNVEQFISDFKDELVDMDDRSWVIKDEKKITSSSLYSVYTNWCCKNGESSFSNRIFVRMIPKEYIKDKGNTRINNKKVRWIQFD